MINRASKRNRRILLKPPDLIDEKDYFFFYDSHAFTQFTTPNQRW
ncbi:hypothetical protein VRK_34030 [Vibrio sp. MEBiC08052]|nr:hypothetical protein VRK_34030 [Vibrio sp. MEBiC08052]